MSGNDVSEGLAMVGAKCAFCGNGCGCAQMFIEARKVFPLHHLPLKAQRPDVQGSVDEGIVVGIPSVQR
jgi:hypothetical protein